MRVFLKKRSLHNKQKHTAMNITFDLIFLVRHAAYDTNSLDGDPELTKQGEGQAHQLRFVIEELIKDFDKPQLIFWHSPKKRSVKTMKSLLPLWDFDSPTPIIHEYDKLYSDNITPPDMQWLCEELEKTERGTNHNQILIIVSHYEYLRVVPLIFGFRNNEKVDYAEGFAINMHNNTCEHVTWK